MFVVSSLMAISTVAHVPANVVWLSRAARSAARRTGKVLGEVILDHYAEVLAEIRAYRLHPLLDARVPAIFARARGAVRPRHESLTERLLGGKN